MCAGEDQQQFTPPVDLLPINRNEYQKQKNNASGEQSAAGA
jgi:hypothetical protein